MASLGWNVTGFEPDKDYFEVARNRFSDNPRIQLKYGGFDSSSQHFDFICWINGSFYYILEAQEQFAALQKCWDSLKEDGILFLDIANFLYILKHYQPPKPQTSTLLIKDTLVHRTPSHKWDYHKSLWIHQDKFIFERNGAVFQSEEVHHFSIVTLNQVIFMLEMIGFTEIRTFNSWTSRQSEYLNGERMMISCQKRIVPNAVFSRSFLGQNRQ